MSALKSGELKVADVTHKAVFGVFSPVEEELTAEQITAVHNSSKATSVHTSISQSGAAL